MYAIHNGMPIYSHTIMYRHTALPAYPTVTLLIGLSAVLLATSAKSADETDTLYRWKEDGQVVYGDAPPNHITAETLQYAGEQITRRQGSMALDTSGRHPVILLTKRDCAVCNHTRSLLYERRVPFREFDIELSSVGRREYERLRASTVPVVMIGRDGSSGQNEATLLQMLDAAGY